MCNQTEPAGPCVVVQASEDDSKTGGFPIILGAVLGGIVALALLLLLAMLRLRRRRKEQQAAAAKLGVLAFSNTLGPSEQDRNYNRVVAFHHIRYRQPLLTCNDHLIGRMYPFLAIPPPPPAQLPRKRANCI